MANRDLPPHESVVRRVARRARHQLRWGVDRSLRPIERRVGRLDSWRRHRRDAAASLMVSTRTDLERHGATIEQSGGEAPIFVLAASWRSGSTLVQRLLNAHDDVLIWGEPWQDGAIVNHLAESLSTAAAQEVVPTWLAPPVVPPAEHLADAWSANYYPPADDLLAAHRALLERLMAEPARRSGRERWGMKEVRLYGEHLAYLRLLYPEARFVLLVRDPWKAWASYREWRHSYARFPDQPVFSPEHFADHWARAATDFAEFADRDEAILLRHEDLVAGDGIERLATFLDLELHPDVLATNRSGKSAERHPRLDVPAGEHALLERRLGAVAATFGYEAPNH